MTDALHNVLWFFIYALSGSLAMAISLAILVKIWAVITPVDDWEELKKGNMAVAVVMAAVILGFALVVAAAVHP